MSLIVSHKFLAGVPYMSNTASSGKIQLQCCYGIQLLVFFKPMKFALTYATPMCTAHNLSLTLSPCKIRVLELSDFAIYGLIPNVTILSAVGCVMNVADETR